MVDGNQNVLSGNDVRHIEASIRVGLVLAQNGDRVAVFNRYRNEQNHRPGTRPSIKPRHSGKARAATRGMNRQRRFARTNGYISSGDLGSFGSQSSEKDIWPALQHNLIAPRGSVQNALRIGISLIAASHGASTFIAVGRKAPAVGVV